jgi:CRISPR-associated protein Cas2
MPYFVAVYDVEVKRVAKMLKLFRRYLTWVQNSVFEGELTEAQYAGLQTEARNLMQGGDSIIFYEVPMPLYMKRTVLGTERGERSRFL